MCHAIYQKTKMQKQNLPPCKINVKLHEVIRVIDFDKTFDCLIFHETLLGPIAKTFSITSQLKETDC